jgi:hypothetical protein
MEKVELQSCIAFIDGLLKFGGFSPVLRAELETEKQRFEDELAKVNYGLLKEPAA